MLRTLSPTPSISTRARRQFRTEFGPERLEDRCLLATNSLSDAIPLGQVSATPIVEQGTIKLTMVGLDNGGDLYSFRVSQGQTVQVNLEYPGETANGQPRFNDFTTSLYEILPPPKTYVDHNAKYLIGDPHSATPGLTPPRPAEYQGLNGPYFQYTFDGENGDANANDSANGLFYIYVDTEGPLVVTRDAPLSVGEGPNGSTVAFTYGDLITPAPYTLTVQAIQAIQNPTAVNQTATTTENQPVPINVLANDTDPNGYSLTIAGVASAATGGMADQSAHDGQLSTSQGVVTYTPPTGYTGPDSFSYTISNGHGGSATATVNISVAPPALPKVSFLSAQENVVINPASGNKTTTVTIFVGIPEASTSPVQVSYAYDAADSTAIPGKNFTDQTSDTLTIPVGSTRGGFVLVIPNTAVNGAPQVYGSPKSAVFNLEAATGADLGATTRSVVKFDTLAFGRDDLESLFQKLTSLYTTYVHAYRPSTVDIVSTRGAVIQYALQAVELNSTYGGDPVFDEAYRSIQTFLNKFLARLNADLGDPSSNLATLATVIKLDQTLTTSASNLLNQASSLKTSLLKDLAAAKVAEAAYRFKPNAITEYAYRTAFLALRNETPGAKTQFAMLQTDLANLQSAHVSFANTEISLISYTTFPKDDTTDIAALDGLKATVLMNNTDFFSQYNNANNVLANDVTGLDSLLIAIDSFTAGKFLKY